eukprot:101713-Pyramimonas_sp.AAC.1
MACPWEQDTCSKVCAVFQPIIRILLPIPWIIVNISFIIVPRWTAKASSWRSPNQALQTTSCRACFCGAYAPTPSRFVTKM